MAGPKMIDISTIIQAGINPKTGLPIKMGGDPCQLKDDIKKIIRIQDEQDAINRFEWEGLPAKITSQDLERMLYYKGQLCFFFMDKTQEYYFMPYALDGTIDFYGRFNSVHPVPMATGTTEDKSAVKAQADYLSTIKLQCIYVEDQIEKFKEKSNECCVLLHDYSKQISQTIISRQIINDPLLDVMAECIPFLRTSLIIGTGVKGMRVNDRDQSENVKEAAESTIRSALTGKPWIPIIGNIEFQDLNEGGSVKPEEFLEAFQSLDNIRLGTYGLENGGSFQKKAHLLESENERNQSNSSIIMEDSLKIRQNFCDVANKLFGLSISVKQKETEAEGANDPMQEGESDDSSRSGNSETSSV